MVVYDAAGTDRQRTELGTMASGQSWQASLDLPASTLDDGDYGVWVFVTAGTAHNMAGPAVQEGVGFLIGRGRVYPSREQVDQRTFTTPPTLSPLRLEGSWIVFDMTNHETFDIEVSHEFAISLEGSVDPQKFRGLELVRAEATQHGHYLLPDHPRWAISRLRDPPERGQRLGRSGVGKHPGRWRCHHVGVSN